MTAKFRTSASTGTGRRRSTGSAPGRSEGRPSGSRDSRATDGHLAGARSIRERAAAGSDGDREFVEPRGDAELAETLRGDDRDLAAVRALADRREKTRLRARQKHRGDQTRAAEVDGDRLSGAARHDRVAFGRPEAPHERPPAVLRERDGGSVREPNRGRSVEGAEIDPSGPGSRLEVLRKQQRETLHRDACQRRAVEPGKLPLLRLAGEPRAQTLSLDGSLQQEPAIRRDVVKNPAARAEDRPRPPASRHGVETRLLAECPASTRPRRSGARRLASCWPVRSRGSSRHRRGRRFRRPRSSAGRSRRAARPGTTAGPIRSSRDDAFPLESGARRD